MASGDVGFASLIDTTVAVLTNDGRHFVGTLKGYDQATNLLLHDCHERVYSLQQGMERQMLGLQVVRGDNISVVGEVDDERDAEVNWSRVHAAPLTSITH
ncbi:hypothetical protein WJX73_002943 [Symbiochloris irregularis]|uniref:U6 snRNA-associated Sm-like protein LSm8 n=1 Tax=Symbiochloris irregularis TaxID=706552 RepID=A0AAW1NZK7_9CHLO